MYNGFTIPASYGGLNLIDAIDSMPPQDAQELLNIYPTGLTTALRGGYSSFVTLTGSSPVRSLYGFTLADGNERLVAATNNKFYEISSGSAIDITGATTPTLNDWSATIFAHRLFLANGTNTVQVYDGVSVTDSTFTGVTLADLINVDSYKERLYFVQKNTASFWYGGVKAVGASALTEYDLKYFFKKGGYLLFSGSWTNQLANTSTDLFMAVSSEGEVLFYSGLSPADTAWSLVAKFELAGKPLGYRAFVRVDNDIWIITDRGIIPVSLLFSGQTTVATNQVSRKINPYISQQASSFSFDHRWTGIAWSQGRRVFINVPTATDDNNLAVCNLDTGAWTIYDYTDVGAATSIAVFESNFYIGGNTGIVSHAESGYSDNNQPIYFINRLAYNFFGSRGNFKAFKDVRPLIKAKRGVALGVAVDTDFKQSTSIDNITSDVGSTSTPWGSPWGSPWGTPVSYLYDRHTLRGQGHCGAIRIQGSVSDTPLEFSAFEVRFELGGQV